jgi:catechol 2,3-dioxygenase-like lactoylglutathione lyase family enzyme
MAQITHMIIWCRDFERMADFYERVIGFEVERRSEQSKWIQFNNGAFSFALMEGGSEGVPTGTPTEAEAARVGPGKGFARCPIDPLQGDTWDPYITVKVDDFEGCLRRLRESGVPMREWPRDRFPDGRLLDVLDPEGNTLAISEPFAS